MQSIFCMLNRVFRWPAHRPVHHLHVDQPKPADGELIRTIYKENNAVPCRTAPLVTPSKAALRVKWHRDNVLERTPFPTRLVISGRMSDVHAELERLAAMESMA